MYAVFRILKRVVDWAGRVLFFGLAHLCRLVIRMDIFLQNSTTGRPNFLGSVIRKGKFLQGRALSKHICPELGFWMNIFVKGWALSNGGLICLVLNFGWINFCIFFDIFMRSGLQINKCLTVWALYSWVYFFLVLRFCLAYIYYIHYDTQTNKKFF